MNEVARTDIVQKLDRILSFDFTKFYPNSPIRVAWSNLEQGEEKALVETIVADLRLLKVHISVLEGVPANYTQTFRDYLQNVIHDYESLLAPIDHFQISDQHHGPLNHLNALGDLLARSGVHGDLHIATLLKKNIPNLKDAKGWASEILNSEAEVRDAIEQARAWLTARSDVHGKTIEEQAAAFHDLANEHKTFRGWGPDTKKAKGDHGELHKIVRFLLTTWRFICWLIGGVKGTWWWILLAFLFAFATAAVTYYFIILAAGGKLDPSSNAPETIKSAVNFGEALLRVTSLAVPAYLTLFCANQYLYHKRMYDSYKFKYSSLNTMNNLISTHSEKAERILDKGMDVLFSEPHNRERSGKYDPQLVNEIIKLLRDQAAKG